MRLLQKVSLSKFGAYFFALIFLAAISHILVLHRASSPSPDNTNASLTLQQKDPCDESSRQKTVALSQLLCPDGLCNAISLKSHGIHLNASNAHHVYLFVHVPKTAGSSVREFFKAICKHNKITLLVTLNARWKAQTPYILARRRHKYNAIFGHFAYGLHRNLFSKSIYTYFGTYRDPVERWLSHFVWGKQKKYEYLRHVELTDWIDMNYDCNLQFAILSGLAPNDFSLQNRMHMSWPVPCGNYDAGNYAFLNRVKETIRRDFAFVVLQSRFTESLILVCDEMKVPDAACESAIKTNHKQIHRTSSKDLLSTLTSEQLEKIKEQNYLDILLHEFLLSLFEEKWSSFKERHPKSRLLHLVQ